MTIGQRVKARREELALTQQDLADRLGYRSKSSINKIELDQRDLPQKMIKALADALDTTPSFIMGWEDERHEGQTEQAPVREALSEDSLQLARRFEALDAFGKDAVGAVLAAEERRLKLVELPVVRPTKVIPLFGAAFAAGRGEPDFGNAWEDYEVDADSRADFAIRVSGNSMEPYLPDGSIALGRRAEPKDGDVAALLVDGEFLVKQVMTDYGHNLLLFSLNRERSDADRVLYANVEHTITCFGTILMEKRAPLPMG